MADMLVFGEPEFFSTTAIRDFCGNARLVLRPMHSELMVAAEELEASLRFVKSADPKAGGLDSRVRAKLVARHLRNSADGILVAQTSLIKTYLSFRKHFVRELDAAGAPAPRPRREFRFDS